MCGRFTGVSLKDMIEIMRNWNESEELGASALQVDINKVETREVFPTNRYPVIEEGLAICESFWGFPKFTGSGAIINARSETVLEKKTFRSPFLERRILIPTLGFFEWNKFGTNDSKTKDKYIFQENENEILFLAGFSNNFQDENRFVILTTEGNSSIADVHDRMPVIISFDKARRYLEDAEFASEVIRGAMPELIRRKVG